MAEIKFDHVYKRFDDNLTAVTDFNLDISNEEFIVLVGPSGCGKSTTLRMIAGLEEVTEGALYIDGEYVNDAPPKDRDIAMVFQNYALYPHMNVFDNIAFGLKLRKFKKDDIKARVRNASQILGLDHYLQRKPKSLSGGQRQRVALGRAIVRDPKVFLMDEPLSNLDANLRGQMRYEIIKLHQRLKTTTIYVTHDQTEAMTMASRVIVMKDGIIQQIGEPMHVYLYPENTFVGGFIGSPSMNFLNGTVRNHHFWINEHVPLKIPEKRIDDLRQYDGKMITMGVRPEDLHDEKAGLDKMQTSNVNVTIDFAEITGSETVIYSKIGDQDMTAVVNLRKRINQGDQVELGFDMDNVHFFNPKTGIRIKPTMQALM